MKRDREPTLTVTQSYGGKIESSSDEETRKGGKKSKARHGKSPSNIPPQDRRDKFEQLLTHSNILDKEQEVKIVIDYIEEFDIFQGKPVHYKIRFYSAVAAIKPLWKDPVILPFKYFMSLLGEEPQKVRDELWFDIDNSGRCALQREKWLDDLDLWISGCATLKGFVEIMSAKSLLEFLGEGSPALDEKLKFRDFSLPTQLNDDSRLLIEADKKNLLSEPAKRKLENLYRPFGEYLDLLLQN